MVICIGWLSNNLLSLVYGKRRYVITLWLTIENHSIIDSRFEKNIIINKKRLTYDNCEKYPHYKEFYNIIHNLCYKNLIFDDFNSHLLVEKLMIIYNCECCDYLIKNLKTPILRKHPKTLINLGEGGRGRNIAQELHKFIKIISNKAALYTFDINSYHSGLELINYGHCTSPIRRYVDCYNQYLIHQVLHNTADLSKLPIDIDHINNESSYIKKAERMFNKLKLASYILETGTHDFKGYIYSVRENRKIEIYIPRNNITISKKLIDNRINNTLHKEGNNITLLDSMGEIIRVYAMNVLIDLEIYVIENKLNSYNKFSIAI